MFVVAFVTRGSGTYLIGEERHVVYFESETDANAFYDDLENFIDKKTEELAYVVSKSKPEKLNDIVLYGYDPSIHSLYRVG